LYKTYVSSLTVLFTSY